MNGASTDRVFPDARRLMLADLSGLGITGQRIEAIKALARMVQSGKLSFDGSREAQNFSGQIQQIKGIGEWTAQTIALRALRDPDAFPHGDLILRRALDTGNPPLSPADLLERAQAWRPWRAYAVILLWHCHQAERLQSESGDIAIKGF